MATVVRTYYCPEVRLPDKDSRLSGTKNKRQFDEAPPSAKRSKASKDPKSMPAMDVLLSSIKEFTSTTLVGSAKQKHKEDKLTKLGVPPPKEQTMPFKMKMGILAGRKRRELKTQSEAKESGVVLAKSKKSGKRVKKDDDDDLNGVGPDWNLKTHKGVLHIGKSSMDGGRRR